MGDFTIAEKAPTIPRIITASRFKDMPMSSKVPWNMPPIRAPITRRGRNIPPGAPEAKQDIEKRNLTKNKISNNFSGIPPAMMLTRSLPPPNTSGSRKANKPAKRKGIKIFIYEREIFSYKF